mgnify:CR=1 FL=1
MSKTDKHIVGIYKLLLHKVVIPLFVLLFIFVFVDKMIHTPSLDQLIQNNSTYSHTSPRDEKLTAYKKAMDVNHKTTRIYALNLAKQNSGTYNYRQVFTIYDDLVNKWNYVNDPVSDDIIAPASFSIEAGLVGDCDDYAVTMATLIECIGGKTRIISASKKKSGHAYAELFVGGEQNKEEVLYILNKRYIRNYPKGIPVHFSVDQNGSYWLNLDWTSKHPGGKYFESDYETVYYPSENKFIYTE